MKNIGIDSGASHTRIWDGTEHIQKIQTPHSYTHYLQCLYDLLKDRQPIHNLAIALAAIVGTKNIITAVNLGEEWSERPIALDLAHLLQITGEIILLQDTEAAGYAVQARELDELEPTMLVTLSTGVGGALVTRDLVMPLEVGHFPLNVSGHDAVCGCGQLGCVEADLSGSGIYRVTGVQAELIEDPFFWETYGRQLGKFFMAIASLFKLKQIVLIGGVSQRHALFLKHAKTYLEEKLKYVPVPIIRVLHMGDNIGVYGSYWRAVQTFPV